MFQKRERWRCERLSRCSTAGRGSADRSDFGEFNRSKVTEAEEADTMALPDPSHDARTARSMRLFDLVDDHLAVGRLGDALGDAVGQQRSTRSRP